MEKSKIDLLPCPFCGETDFHLESFSGFGTDVVICRGCLATFSQQEITCEEDLIKAWNTRASGWIPCSERIPEKSTSVLISAQGHRVTAFYDSVKGVFMLTETEGLFYSMSAVTHWMPLPDPPEAEDKA